MAIAPNALAPVLVVDDEEFMRETLIDILEEFNYRVQVASNGQEALEHAQARDCSLVLMDVRMPVLDGLSALRMLKALKPELPVIMMTAHEDAATTSQARTYGALAVLGKPLDLARLLQLLQQSLGAP
jgi:two-component system response regulator (stage 0 sporulation protein F)